MGRETGSQGICIQSRCEMGRKREGTFSEIMGSILCPLPGAGEGGLQGAGRRAVISQHSHLPCHPCERRLRSLSHLRTMFVQFLTCLRRSGSHPISNDWHGGDIRCWCGCGEMNSSLHRAGSNSVKPFQANVWQYFPRVFKKFHFWTSILRK